MKKLFALIILFCVAAFVGCDPEAIQSDKPFFEPFSQRDSAVVTSREDLTDGEREYLIGLIRDAVYENGIAKYSYNYTFLIDGERWDYFSWDGAGFCCFARNVCFMLSKEDKKKVDQILQNHGISVIE